MRFKYKLISSRERLRQEVFTIWVVLFSVSLVEGCKSAVSHAEAKKKPLFRWRCLAETGFRGPVLLQADKSRKP